MKHKSPQKHKQPEKKIAQAVSSNKAVAQNKANAPLAKKDRTYLYMCLGILALTLFIFHPVAGFDFVNWDDDRYVIDNPFLKQLTATNILVYFKQFYFLMYLPLTMLTYVVDTAIAGGLKPGMFHFTNLLLHLFNTTMVFFVVLKLETILRGKKDWLMPTIVAALFGIVTSHVESVAWVAERKDVLYTAFLLISFYLYLSYHQTQKQKFYWLAWFVFVCSLVSKAQAFPFAVILFFLDGLLLGTYLNKRRWLEKIPFVAVAVFFAALAILGNKSDSDGFSSLDYSFFERISFACYGYVMYIVKLFVPFNMAVIHPYPVRVDGHVPFMYWLFVVPVLAVVALFFYLLRKNQRLVFGIAFYSFSIVIILQLFAYHNFLMAERYSYVSSIGIFYILAYGIHEFVLSRPQFKTIVLAAFGLFVALMCFLTSERLTVWKDSASLWDDELLKYPKVIIAHYNWGNYKAEKGDLKGAMSSYNKALEINSDYIPALSNRGVTEGKLNDPKSALADLEHVARLDPKYKNVYSNIGNVRVMLGDTKSAVKDYDKALSIAPDFPDALYNRGQAKLTLQDYSGAVADFNSLIKVKPDYGMVFHARGMALLNLGKSQEALADFLSELQRNPNSFETLYARGVCYLGLKQYDLALSDLNQVVQANPKVAMPYYQRAMVYLGKGAGKQACADFNQALSLGFAPAQQMLAQYCK